MDLGLLQRDIAARIGTSKASVTNWEKGHREPELRFIPAIIAFLGYDPRPEPQRPLASASERLDADRGYRSVSLGASGT